MDYKSNVKLQRLLQDNNLDVDRVFKLTNIPIYRIQHCLDVMLGVNSPIKTNSIKAYMGKEVKLSSKLKCFCKDNCTCKYPNKSVMEIIKIDKKYIKGLIGKVNFTKQALKYISGL